MPKRLGDDDDDDDVPRKRLAAAPPYNKRRAADADAGIAHKRLVVDDPDLDDGVSDDEGGDDVPVVQRKKRAFGEDADNDDERPSGTQHALTAEGEVGYNEGALNELDGEDGDIEPFNLNAERDMGHFGEDGNFTWTRRDLDEDDDPWLEQVGGSVKHRNARAAAAGDDDKLPSLSQREGAKVMGTIARILKSGETCLEALRRLKADKAAFARLTEAADVLLSQGLMNVYSEKREAFAARLPALEWTYTVDGVTHGPISGSDMEAWREDGFFEADGVRVRCAGEVARAKDVDCFLVPLDV